MAVWKFIDKQRAKLHREVFSVIDCGSTGSKFESQLGHITFAEIDHEIIFTVILLLPLILEERLSVTDERMCASTG